MQRGDEEEVLLYPEVRTLLSLIQATEKLYELRVGGTLTKEEYSELKVLTLQTMKMIINKINQSQNKIP
jgi:hypothetical protein